LYFVSHMLPRFPDPVITTLGFLLDFDDLGFFVFFLNNDCVTLFSSTGLVSDCILSSRDMYSDTKSSRVLPLWSCLNVGPWL